MSRSPEPECIDPDWNEIWKERQKRHELSKLFNDPSHNWNKLENAERYHSTSNSEYDDRVKTTIAGLEITKNSRCTGYRCGTRHARDTARSTGKGNHI